MRLHSKTILVMAALVLAACTNPGRFGAGGAGAGGSDASQSGSISDPTSPAYFQETIGDRVLFAVDEHGLTPEARSVLNQQATWMMANTDYSAVIEGHADEQGTSAYNVALSARRANSVIEFLVERGVSSARLRALPLGKERPIAICSQESCYAQNRRAVSVLSAGNLS
jgi:peptidoglycan-associated lipoprotein